MGLLPVLTRISSRPTFILGGTSAPCIPFLERHTEPEVAQGGHSTFAQGGESPSVSRVVGTRAAPTGAGRELGHGHVGYNTARPLGWGIVRHAPRRGGR
jgi:hypothetical protein